ncbi:putative phage abortive infection protein [Aliarcobacter butzleri]|uniref:putative phage abortive infection protein n=1 Tax=Aliarcobacter butzleri TaxID=28197 RepID=UPI000DB7F501|nr:MAG: hypothetical protein DI567_02790 [Aliarcobacter butzleri]
MTKNKKKKDIDFLDENYLKISNALNDEERTRKSLFYIFIIALCIIGSIFLIELILVICFYDIDKLGAFGDFFGGMINPLLTFCTFMALLMTIILQQRELKLSREQVAISTEELGHTRKATEISSEALTQQAKSLKIQNFENTFFNMINLHNEIVNNLSLEKHFIDYETTVNEYNSSKKTLTITSNFNNVTKIYNSTNKIFYKREAISMICKNIDEFILNRHKEDNCINIQQMYNIKLNYNSIKNYNINLNRPFHIVFNLCYESYRDILSNYFNNVFQILNFICINTAFNIKKYIYIFRAQFSPQELKILFYFYLSNSISQRFKERLEESNFFEQLSIDKNNEIFKYIFFKYDFDDKIFGEKTQQNNKFKEDINLEIKQKLNDKEFLNYTDYKYLSNDQLSEELPKLKEKIEQMPKNGLNSNQLQENIHMSIIINDFSEEKMNYTLKDFDNTVSLKE